MRTAAQHLEESMDKTIADGYEWVYEAMKAYAQEACKEQREICAASARFKFSDMSEYEIIQELIKNAPSPEFK